LQIFAMLLMPIPISHSNLQSANQQHTAALCDLQLQAQECKV
jgi:hypothetical protein